MDRWEYKTITANLLQDSELNKLGQQGWEMAGMSDSSNGPRIAVMKRKNTLITYTECSETSTKSEL